MEPSGLKIDKLDYEGSSDDEEERLGDEHVEQLAGAMADNNTFSGSLDLSKNNLTDQVSTLHYLIIPLVGSIPQPNAQQTGCAEHYQAQFVQKL